MLRRLTSKSNRRERGSCRTILFALLAFNLVAVQAVPLHPAPENSQVQTSAGPAKGALVIQGGGDILPEIWERFIKLAGGPDANFVFIPTAEDPIDPNDPSQDEFPTRRFKHVTVLTPPAKLLEAISRSAPRRRADVTGNRTQGNPLFQQSGPPEKLDEPLTPQEMRLLKLPSEGHSYQDAWLPPV